MKRSPFLDDELDLDVKNLTFTLTSLSSHEKRRTPPRLAKKSLTHFISKEKAKQ